MSRQYRVSLLLLVLLLASTTLLFAPLFTYREVQSPDGEFRAIAKASLIDSLIPRMPGQGGDTPGRITVIRKDGAACGSAPVEMVNLISDLRWYLDSRPREASLVATARWNLDTCNIEVHDR